MRTLLYGISIIIVVGIAGFLYRDAMESTAGHSAGSACTLEAKICPDGTTVSRSGPNCAFAACPPDNIEMPSSGIAFALPDGYTVAPDTSAGPAALGTYANTQAAGTTTSAGTIIVRDFSIPPGGSASAVILAQAIRGPSGLPAPSMNQFTPKVIGSNTFESIVLSRFEGTVDSAYFLSRSADVLEFEIIETGVSDWTDPNLNVDALPQHQAFLKLLASLQVTDPALAQPPASASAATSDSASS